MRAVDTSQHVSLERSEWKPGPGWGRGAEAASSLPPKTHTEHVEASSHGLPNKKKHKTKQKKLFAMGTM